MSGPYYIMCSMNNTRYYFTGDSASNISITTDETKAHKYMQNGSGSIVTYSTGGKYIAVSKNQLHRDGKCSVAETIDPVEYTMQVTALDKYGAKMIFTYSAFGITDTAMVIAQITPAASPAASPTTGTITCYLTDTEKVNEVNKKTMPTEGLTCTYTFFLAHAIPDTTTTMPYIRPPDQVSNTPLIVGVVMGISTVLVILFMHFGYNRLYRNKYFAPR